MAAPVLFIPGFPGSHLHEIEACGTLGRRVFLNATGLIWPRSQRRILARLALGRDGAPRDLQPGQPVRKLASFLFFDLGKQAGSLYGLLDRLDVRVFRLGWDWRLRVDDQRTRSRVQAAVESLYAEQNQPLTVIVHSTGGLVFRHFLESAEAATLDKIERVLAFGVPWVGSLKALELLSGQLGVGPIGGNAARELMATTYAAYDLLPPDPARTPMRDEAGTDLSLVIDAQGRQISALGKGFRRWFSAGPRELMSLRADDSLERLGGRRPSLRLERPVELVNVVGWGAETAVQAVIGPGEPAQIRFLKSKGDLELEGGDGTVARSSAAWLRGKGVRTLHVPVGVDPGGKTAHAELWRTPGGRSLLRRYLTGAPPEPFVWAAVDDQDHLSGRRIRIRLVALDDDGKALPEARVRAIRRPGRSSPWSHFDCERGGRHLFTVSRSSLAPVSSSSAFRRIWLEVVWREGSKIMGFFVRR